MPLLPVISFLNPRLSERTRQVFLHPALVGCLFWALIVGIAWAADCFLVTERYGATPFGGFGASIVLIGDINADGATISEVLVGAPTFPGSPSPAAGLAFVLDGVTFLPFRTHQGEEPQDRFGWVVAALGDQDLDGIPDYGVGSPGWDGATDSPLPDSIGRAYVFSGSGGATIRILEGFVPEAEFGFSLSPGYDLDASTVAPASDDFAVGAPGDLGGTIERRGAVYVYLAGAPMPIRLVGEQDGDRFGHAVAVLPVPATGRPLIVVGAPGADSSPPDPQLPDAGAVYLFDSSGVLQYVLTGAAPGDRFGAALAVTADVNSDGQPDLAVGSPTAGGVGRVSVHSGRTGQLLHERFGQVPGQELGYAVAGLGDMTNDADSDVGFGSPGFSTGPLNPIGMAHVVRGGSGIELCEPIGRAPGDRFGHVIAPAGDLDGDGLHEIWVGAPGSSDGGVQFGGVIRLYTVVPGPPLGTVRVTGFDDGGTDGGPLTMDWDYPFGGCAAIDFAVYRGRCTETPCDAATDLAIETCSTGGATTVTLPAPHGFEPGTCYFYFVAPLTNNEESLGLTPFSDAGTAVSLPRNHPTVACRVFLNPVPCQ